MIKSRSVLRYLLLSMLILTVVLILPSAGSAAGSSITTMFAATNAYAGNMFDVTVLSATDIMIDSFDINIDASDVPLPVQVYYRLGSYIGEETNASAWTLVGSADVSSQGLNNATHVPIGGIQLTAGETYGFYVTINYIPGAALNYTTGSNTYEDSALKITCGIGQGWPQFTNIFDPRIWNGTIYYTVIPAPTPTPAPTPAPTPTPEPTDIPQTGDPFGQYLWLYVSLTVLSGGAILLLKMKRSVLHMKK